MYLDSANTFHVDAIPLPELKSVTPNSFKAGKTINLTIKAANAHFTQATPQVEFNFGSNFSVKSQKVVDDNTIKLQLTLPADTYTGDYSLFVTDLIDGYLPLYNGIHVDGKPRPALVSISPASAVAGQTLTVTIKGVNTNFKKASSTTVNFSFYSASGTTVVQSVKITDNETINAKIKVPANLYTGKYSVYVYDALDGYLALYDTFYVSGITPPSIKVSRDSVYSGQTLNITITGVNTHFAQASDTKVDFGFNCTLNSTTIVNNNKIVANVTVGKPGYSGWNSVMMYNQLDGALFDYWYIIDTTSYHPWTCNSNFRVVYDSISNVHYFLTDSTSSVGTRYMWNFGDGTTSNFASPSHTFTSVGYHTVCLTTISANLADSCTYCSAVYTDSLNLLHLNGVKSLGIDEKSSDLVQVNVYPNPAVSELTVAVDPRLVSLNGVIELYSIEGRLISQQRVSSTNTPIDISNLPSGIYYVKVSGNNVSSDFRKFVKQE
jgi:hypothetical protein